MKIKVLSKDIADKIAAGEVIEQPLSVVKELIENSIDAKANLITVEIKEGGKSYIRVSDNGFGIEKDDIKTAFLPHATSKINTEEDLDNILSLGFRGEALTSIAAVSRLELFTKTEDSKTGNKISIEASEIISFEECACETGTSIIVRDLFFNLPARLKFMKTDAKEASLITEFVSKISIAYPEIKFRFINNGNILFSTAGKGDVYNTILTVYNAQNARKLLPVNFKNNSMCVKGYVSSPLESRQNRKQQINFVNGRLVSSKLIDNAISMAYEDKLFEGRFPSTYLFIEIEPILIDVNIHPRKTDIKFLNEDTVRDFLILAIRRALLSTEALNVDKDDVKASKIAANFVTKSEPEKSITSIININAEKSISETIQNNVLDNEPDSVKKQSENRNIISENSNKLSDNSDNSESSVSKESIPVFPYLKINNNPAIPIQSDKTSIFKELREKEVSTEQITLIQEDSDEFKADRLYFSELNPLCQVFVTYVLATDKDNFYIIDQHAAHERIMYEKILAAFNNDEISRQSLLSPFVIDIDRSLMINSGESLQILDSMGFTLEEFGDASFIVKEIPSYMDIPEASDFVNEFFEASDEYKDKIQIRKDLIISRSCKSAVKAHDKLSIAEMKRLFEDLDKCENPFSCPHGRPTFLRFSEYELEKMFKRK